MASSTASRLNTGRAPGSPRHTGHTLVFGGAPNPVGHPQKILVRVPSWTWTSSPITGSYFAMSSGGARSMVTVDIRLQDNGRLVSVDFLDELLQHLRKSVSACRQQVIVPCAQGIRCSRNDQHGRGLSKCGRSTEPIFARLHQFHRENAYIPGTSRGIVYAAERALQNQAG